MATKLMQAKKELAALREDLPVYNEKIQTLQSKHDELDNELSQYSETRAQAEKHKHKVTEQFAMGEVKEEELAAARKEFRRVLDAESEAVELLEAYSRSITNCEADIAGLIEKIGIAHRRTWAEVAAEQRIKASAAKEAVMSYCAARGSAGGGSFEGFLKELFPNSIEEIHVWREALRQEHGLD